MTWHLTRTHTQRNKGCRRYGVRVVCVHVCASGRGEGWVFFWGGVDVEAPYGHSTPCTPHPCKQADVKWDVPPWWGTGSHCTGVNNRTGGTEKCLPANTPPPHTQAHTHTHTHTAPPHQNTPDTPEKKSADTNMPTHNHGHLSMISLTNTLKQRMISDFWLNPVTSKLIVYK